MTPNQSVPGFTNPFYRTAPLNARQNAQPITEGVNDRKVAVEAGGRGHP